LCVNPQHLQELTRAQHTKYAAAKGWLSAGHKKQRCNQKIPDAGIRFIKESYRDREGVTEAELVNEIEEKFGVSITPGAILPIRQGKRGGHVAVPGFVPIQRRISKRADAVDINQIMALIREGKTQTEIAELVNRSQQGISKIIRAYKNREGNSNGG